MTWKLLEEEVLWKQSKVVTGGQLVNGIWVDGTTTITYPEIEGYWEPYQRGATGDVLPEGVKSTDAIVVFTEDILKTHSDLSGSTSLPDKVYIDNPSANPDVQTYVVFDRMYWKQNGGFQLLSGHSEYIAIREEKL